MTLTVYHTDTGWISDNNKAVDTINIPAGENNYVYSTNISIPVDLRSCKPNSRYYFYLRPATTTAQDYSTSTCSFLPENFNSGLDCDKITYPTQRDVLTLNSSHIDWELKTPSDWQGYNLEFYLYREIAWWPDSWWLTSQAAAVDLKTTYSQLQVSTTADAKWYFEAYYRYSVGTVSFPVRAMESQRFFISDGNPNDSICKLVAGKADVALQCCSSSGTHKHTHLLTHISYMRTHTGMTTTDLCRLSTPTGYELEVSDVIVSLVYPVGGSLSLDRTNTPSSYQSHTHT